MTTTTAQTPDDDRALKARDRAMWALGDYPALADEIIPDLGSLLVSACGVRPGDRVLDVAAGSGNAAIPAARAGARVVACDLAQSCWEPARPGPRRRACRSSGGGLTPRRCRLLRASSTP